MNLGLFIQLPGQHLASWRHPSSQSHRNYDLDYLIEIAQTAERGKFDMLFIADSVARPIHENSYSELKLDPLMILAALSGATKKSGLPLPHRRLTMSRFISQGNSVPSIICRKDERAGMS
ncbi:LLM class flavin-dependent oxidoreductase [Paenibacillus cisolokensis]|uniref:LLM class flavin-dependent oxidoreductase n=1 Tax=Paenibacillus cisolokensis TaxID=1658519 RepID=UPI0027DE719B|nr:LLM class flavin-dependent oxidoreductase [Paenibacillus cisolokensis]